LASHIYYRIGSGSRDCLRGKERWSTPALSHSAIWRSRNECLCPRWTYCTKLKYDFKVLIINEILVEATGVALITILITRNLLILGSATRGKTAPIGRSIVRLLYENVFRSDGQHPPNSAPPRRTRNRHDKRRFFSDARATPPSIFGLMTNSSTVTFERSTRYSSTSRFDSGGLKFHC
jgi:hypothetical protein